MFNQDVADFVYTYIQVLIESKCGRILPDWMRFIKVTRRRYLFFPTTDAQPLSNVILFPSFPFTHGFFSCVASHQGVVDSEDLPLSISREKAQDTALLKRIERVLVRKVLKFLEDQARKDPATYKEKFFKEFGYFLKVRSSLVLLLFAFVCALLYTHTITSWWPPFFASINPHTPTGGYLSWLWE